MENIDNEELLKQTIGKNIAEYRKIAKLSQIEFAEKLNYSDKAVSKWERGESLPDIIVLKKIADILGLTVNDLIATTPSKKRKKIAIKKLLQNKVLLVLIWIALVWLVATTCFAFFTMFNLTSRNWLVFLYAVPISFIVCVIFAAIWKYKFWQMIFASLFIWTAFINVCITLRFTSIWILLVVAVPLQILFVLVYFFRRKKKW